MLYFPFRMSKAFLYESIQMWMCKSGDIKKVTTSSFNSLSTAEAVGHTETL